jgi:hypothetical protein
MRLPAAFLLLAFAACFASAQNETEIDAEFQAEVTRPLYSDPVFVLDTDNSTSYKDFFQCEENCGSSIIVVGSVVPQFNFSYIFSSIAPHPALLRNTLEIFPPPLVKPSPGRS